MYNENTKAKKAELEKAASDFEKTDEHKALVAKLSDDLEGWFNELHANVVC
jgi:hypothetical protein